MKYDVFNTNEYEAHQLELGLIDDNARVLDIGCATGLLARELLKKNCETWGIDKDGDAIRLATKHCHKTYTCDLESCDKLPVPKKYFDYVTFFDVIEHLRNPENILSVIKPYVKKGGRVIVSTPNIAHASIRWMLANGTFEYSSTGIMDDTHVHFYTRDSLSRLLEKQGFKVQKIIPTNGMCKVPLICKITDKLPVSWQYRLVNMLPTLFSYQFIAVTKIGNQ